MWGQDLRKIVYAASLHSNCDGRNFVFLALIQISVNLVESNKRLLPNLTGISWHSS